MKGNDSMRQNDMALSRKDAMNRALNLSKRFVEHFDKIYNSQYSSAKNHWATEMQAWLDSILIIKLKETNNALSLQQKMDWFFTCGSDSTTLFKDMNEAATYDDFINELAIHNDVRRTLVKCNLY